MDSAEFHPGDYLTFRLAGQEFAIAAARVKAIVSLCEMEAAEAKEGCPKWLLGRAVVGGRLIDVLDLAQWLGLAGNALGHDPYIVIVESDCLEGCGVVGFPVDRICDVIIARGRDYSRGKLRIGRPRRVLDADRLFSERVLAGS